MREVGVRAPLFRPLSPSGPVLFSTIVLLAFAINRFLTHDANLHGRHCFVRLVVTTQHGPHVLLETKELFLIHLDGPQLIRTHADILEDLGKTQEWVNRLASAT